MKKFFVTFLAAGLGTGYAPFASGSVGSIPPWLIAYFLLGDNQLAFVIVTAITTIASVWLAGEGEKYFGHDSKKIVIDEWAGMFITLLLVPFSLTNYLIAFVVFRALDVIKIFPARQAEKLPGGWGVTMDDVVAGIQSNIVTLIIIHIKAKF